MFPETNKRSLNFIAWEYGPTALGALSVKTGVKAGSVVIVEVIVLLKVGLSVRTWIRVVRWTKYDEMRSDLVNMVVFGKHCSY